MKAIREHNLKTSLAITTNIGCRNMCRYCPQKTVIRAYRQRSEEQMMSFETFRKCLKSVPREVPLSFSGFSEPWLNPLCTSMVRYAHEQDFAIRVNTTLIGMNTDDIHQLAAIPFIKFVVHLPDNQKMTRIRVDQTYLDNVSLLCESGMASLHWKFHKSSPRIQIHRDVNQVLEGHRARVEFYGLNSRAGQVKNQGVYKAVNRGKILRACQDFHHNILLPNGELALCHMDWSLQHILGNLMHDDYADIFRGKAFLELLDALNLPEADILCRSCEKDVVKRSLPQQVIHLLSKRISGRKDIY